MLRVSDFTIGDQVMVKESAMYLLPRFLCEQMHTRPMFGQVAILKGRFVGIKFDEDVGGHNLGGLCEHGHGYYLYPDCLEILQSYADRECESWDNSYNIEELLG